VKVLVAGATSRVGRALCPLLEQRGHHVRAMSRSGNPVTGASEVVAADVCASHTLGPAVDAVDAVISLVGASLWPVPQPGRETTFEETDRDGNLALFEAAREAGVARAVYLSVFGDYPPGLGYVESHRAVEAWLTQSGWSSAVVRPTGFFGSFDIFSQLAATRVSVRVGAGTARTNPIHEQDLAVVLADALSAEGILDCGGPEVLSRRAIAELALGGRPGALAPVPPFVLRAQALAARTVSKRVSDILYFLHHVSVHDAVAPACGERRLADYFRGRN
jgi:uncharacterized protein YbjT (DUF2867 family)